MSSRADKAQKSQKDKHHAILRELVQELPNKTCAECLAKGPRWSSWSLGVFVCIRCAGIHRNLGVHISKMKSIDLDSWNTEQIENVLKWGNKRAAEYYECYLPKDFVRPQATHALENFIRNKYEKKLYIKKDGEPPANPQSKLDRLKSDRKEEKPEKEKKSSSSTSRQRRAEKKREEPTTNGNNTILNMASKTDQSKPTPVQNTLGVEQHVKSHSMNDLLSLNHPSPAANEVKHSASSNDLLNFGGWSDPVPSSTPSNDLFNTASTPAPQADPFANNSQPSNDLFQNNTSSTNTETSTAPAKSTKESILSLYGSGSNMQQQMPQQQQMYGVPGGVYTMNNMNMMQQQQRMPQAYQGYQQPAQMNQMNQLNNQMQQMNFNQHQPRMMQAQQGQNIYNQQQQQPQQNMYNQQQMMYNAQQQQRPNNMMNNRMNNYPQMQQQQGYNPQMGQQPANMGWSATANQQQGMMGQQQQPQMQNGFGNFNNMNGGMSSGNTGGNTMNNLLWN